MLLRRIPQSNKKDTTENMNFRFASGLSFEFLRGESSMYLATTEEGVIYRCSKSYTQQYLEIYSGHNGPIYKVRSNPFLYDVFLTCSSDWSCKLWNWRRDTPLNSFQSLDIYDEVIDIEWSPNESTVFASVCKDGRLELWYLFIYLGTYKRRTCLIPSAQ
jgi:WD40 repeat protein